MTEQKMEIMTDWVGDKDILWISVSSRYRNHGSIPSPDSKL